MTVVCTAAVLLSAALMFVVEPMFARMVLPMLGGTPAVWSTALVFYQVALLAAYLYVHWSTTRLGVGRQAVLHLALMAAAWTVLPVAIPAGWRPPAGDHPVPWLLALLAAALGPPFLVVASTGPLVQKWFAAAGGRRAPDPYFLYGASNLGSLAGLLAYPLVLEPRLRLAEQSGLWSWGYGALMAAMLVCALLTLRAGRSAAGARPAPGGEPPPVGEPAVPPGARRRFRWLALAFAPASLMMGVTTHITTDVAAVPLLWVGPLALYLLSFALAFARRPWLPHALWVRALPLLVVPLLVVLVGRPAHPLPLLLGLHALVLLVAAMVCHGELARDRPPARHLTEFYLWLALGGALGGLFNALLAPLLFDAVVEYPLAIVLACMLAPARGGPAAAARPRLLDLALPALVAAVAALTIQLVKAAGFPAARPLVVLLAAALSFPLYGFSRRPLRFALGVGAVLLVNPAGLAEEARALHAERSFFGVHRVLADTARGLNALYHGTTLHGVQRVRPRACGEPLGYYGRSGPLGEVFAALEGRGLHSVAVAGLGSGAVAAYARPGQRWTFFEIDPAVQRIADDPRYFCYLASAPVRPELVLGDARLSLERASQRFDLIVLDAYSSDAIPVHLLTREAVIVYRSRLAARGVLVFHISNQYFDLAPVVARLAGEAGLLCWVKHAPSGERERDAGLLPSTYAVAARRDADVGALAAAGGWRRLEPGPAAASWTDDYSSLFTVMRSR
jgi:hypothetical protein